MSEATQKTEAEQAGILIWGTIAAQAASLLAPVAILYFMADAEVGAFATIMLMYETLLVLFVAGFPRAVLYFLVDRPPEARRAIALRLVGINFVIGGLASLLFVVLGVFGDSAVQAITGFLSSHLHRDAGIDESAVAVLPHLPMLAVFVLFDIPARLLPNILLAEKRPRASAAVGVVYSLGVALATLVPAAAGWGIAGVFRGVAVFGVAYGLVFSLALWRIYAHARTSVRASVIPRVFDLFRYSVPLGLTDAVNKLNSSLDTWLIAMSFPLAAVAHYKAGAVQIPFITTIAYSVGTAYLSRYARHYNAGDGRGAIRLWRENIQKVALIVVPAALVFIVGAEEFCRLIYPDGYGASAGVFRSYCFLVLVRVTAFGAILVAAGQTTSVLKAASLTLIFNALISVPLVSTVGFYGPAIGTALTFIPSALAYSHYIAKASGVPLTYTFPLVSYLRVLLAALPGCAVAVAIKLLVPWDFRVVFAIETLVILASFAALASATRLLTRDDWVFASNWIRLRVMK